MIGVVSTTRWNYNNCVSFLAITIIDDVIHNLLFSPGTCQKKEYNRLNYGQNVTRLIMSKSMLLAYFLLQTWLFGKFTLEQITMIEVLIRLERISIYIKQNFLSSYDMWKGEFVDMCHLFLFFLHFRCFFFQTIAIWFIIFKLYTI